MRRILLLIVVVLFCLSCKQNKDKTKIEQQVKHLVQSMKFEISIEPKMELLTIVLNYAKWPYCGNFRDTSYAYYKDMCKHFDKYNEHETIKWFKTASENWNLDDPYTAMLWFSGSPLKQTLSFPLHPTCQIDTSDMLEFVARLNQFADDADFQGYWTSSEKVRQAMINEIKKSLPYEQYTKLLEDFYGEVKSKFRFILAPLMNGASFGPQTKTKDETVCYFISGFTEMNNGKPSYSVSELRELIFHEFGHSFVNPICEEYREELFEHEHLFEYMREDMSSIAYPDWFPTCHEHIVRAGEGLLMKKAGFIKEAEENYKTNLTLGFKMLPFLKEKMEYYDENREKYKSFKEFFPEILKVIGNIDPLELKWEKQVASEL